MTDLTWWDKRSDPREHVDSNREVWAAVHANYAVSNYGRCASKARGSWRALRPSLTSAGYLSVMLGEGTILVHQAVVRTFDGVPPTPAHTDIRHLDGVKTNNELTNLRYGTRSENMLDVSVHRAAGMAATRDRQIDEAKRENRWFGGRSWDSDLVELLLTMERERKLTQVDVARILDVSRDTVQNIVLGRVRSAEFEPVLADRVKQAKRTPPQKERILQCVRAGWTRDAINQLELAEIGKPLTHQDMYYYKTLA